MMDITDTWLMPRIDTIYLVALLLIAEIVKVHWFIRNMLWVVRFLFGIAVYLIARHIFFISLYFYRKGNAGFSTWIKDNYGSGYFFKGDLGIKLETYNEQLTAYKIDLAWLSLYFFLGLWLVWRLSHKLAKYKKELDKSPVQSILNPGDGDNNTYK